MLIFDYRCEQCNVEQEFLIGGTMFDTPLCPECMEPMERMMPAPGLLKTNFADKNSVRKR